MIAESFMMGRDASKNFLSGGKDCGGSESARAHNLLDAGVVETDERAQRHLETQIWGLRAQTGGCIATD